ncbi:MAG: pyruvate formate lyase family protein, partial [Ignavibacteriaceae bacterium]
LGYHMAINLAIGGQTEDGKDAVNDLSYLVLEACGDVQLFTPSISVRWFEGTDDKFIEKALEVVQVHKGGMPAFYNDKAFIRTLLEMGIDKKDAWNWAPVGCIEATIPGKWDYAAKGSWLSVAKVLEITLNNGKYIKVGKKQKLKVSSPQSTIQVWIYRKIFTILKIEYCRLKT